MKKILIGFIAIGLLTFVGCKKEIKDGPGMGVTDVDGNTYKSVVIGEQEWMAENLRTTKYADGTAITNMSDDLEYYWTGAWCYFNNDSIYGKLYNWNAVETDNLCPTGWHVPTNREWTKLTDYLATNGHNGTALKATSGWNSDGNGTDVYGWNGVPGGFRNWRGDFEHREYGYWWSSSRIWFAGDPKFWYRLLGINNDLMVLSERELGQCFSVRCIRD